MHYGLARKISIVDLETGEEEIIVSTPGDYIQSQIWVNENMKDMPGEIEELYGYIAWAYFALKRKNLLGKYKIADNCSVAAIDALSNRLTTYFETIDDGENPLPIVPEKKK